MPSPIIGLGHQTLLLERMNIKKRRGRIPGTGTDILYNEVALLRVDREKSLACDAFWLGVGPAWPCFFSRLRLLASVRFRCLGGQAGST